MVCASQESLTWLVAAIGLLAYAGLFGAFLDMVAKEGK